MAVACPLHRQCEKPDKGMSEIQSSRYSHIETICSTVPTEDEEPQYNHHEKLNSQIIDAIGRIVSKRIYLWF